MSLTTERMSGMVRMMVERDGERDAAMADALAMREGRWTDVAGAADVFPDFLPKPVVANQIDTIARDIAGVLGAMPTFDCSSANITSTKARKFADKRTQIVKSYLQASNVQEQALTAVDRWVTFGFMPIMVEPCFVKPVGPRIFFGDPRGAHYILDRTGRKTKIYVECSELDLFSLCGMYPEAEGSLCAEYGDSTNKQVKIARWQGEDGSIDLFDYEAGIKLDHIEPLLDRPLVRIIESPHVGTLTRGQFDDVIWLQIARAMAGAYTLQAFDESLNADLVVPTDVTTISTGKRGIMRTNNPGGVGRVDLQIPNGAWAEIQNLTQELMTGARYTAARAGQIEASVVTGQGVEALQGTWNTQTTVSQTQLASAYADVVSWCLELDEKLWPNRSRSVRILDQGSQYDVTYVPSSDIGGDYTVNVQFGALAGLDPNRALIWALQALSAGIISKDTAMRQLAAGMGGMDVEKEKQQMNTELLDGSMLQIIAGYPALLPQLAAQGQDPSQIIAQVALVQERLQKGDSVFEAVQKAFPPPPPPPPPDAGTGAGGPGAPGSPFDQQTGLPQGTAPGQAGQGPGGAQDLLMSLAGLSNSGQPQLGATVSRRQPTFQ